MVVSRLFLLVPLAIAMLLTHKAFAQETKPASASEPLDLNGDTQESQEKFDKDSASQNDEKVATRKESTTENDTTISDEDSAEEGQPKTGGEEGKEQDSYGEGSVCVYCQYCKFCKLCKRDCPCKKSKKRPNCHMCKYCKYCYLCESVCDNFCKPGSFLDTISSAVWSALPKFDNKMKSEVENDIESVKNWIKDYL